MGLDFLGDVKFLFESNSSKTICAVVQTSFSKLQLFSCRHRIGKQLSFTRRRREKQGS